MRVFAWIASCIVIASAIAVENLYEDTENTSDAALFLDMDQMPIDTLAMTDFSIPYSLGQESLNLFESDDLASNFLSPEKMDSVLIGDTSNRCTNLIGNKRRIRRAGEAFCSNQDSGPVPYDYFKLDFSAASTFPVTGFDRLKCGVNPVPSYLVCSAPDPSDPLTASLSALGSLDPCTRVNNAEDLSKCRPPSNLYCCRIYHEFRDLVFINGIQWHEPYGVGSLCTPLESLLLP